MTKRKPLIGLTQGDDSVLIGGWPATNYAHIPGTVLGEGRPVSAKSDFTAVDFLPDRSNQAVEIYMFRDRIDAILATRRGQTVVDGKLGAIDATHQGIFLESLYLHTHSDFHLIELNAIVERAEPSELVLKPLAVGWSNSLTVALQPADRDGRFAEGQLIHVEDGTPNPVGHHLHNSSRAMTCRPEDIEILRKQQPDDCWNPRLWAVEISGLAAPNHGRFVGHAKATGRPNRIEIALLDKGKYDIPLFAQIHPDHLEAALDQRSGPRAFKGFFHNGEVHIDRPTRPWQPGIDEENELILGGGAHHMSQPVDDDLRRRYRSEAAPPAPLVLRYGHDAQRAIVGLDPADVHETEQDAPIKVVMEYRNGFWVPKERRVSSLSGL
jgi:hypothetical protein